MLNILLLGVVCIGMLVENRKVVVVARLTRSCREVVVGSTGILFQWSVNKRHCSEEGDGDSLYVLLRASAITLF